MTVIQRPLNLLSVLRFLAQQQMNHVFVEAGPTLAGQFIDQALIDQFKYSLPLN